MTLLVRTVIIYPDSQGYDTTMDIINDSAKTLIWVSTMHNTSNKPYNNKTFLPYNVDKFRKDKFLYIKVPHNISHKQLDILKKNNI